MALRHAQGDGGEENVERRDAGGRSPGRETRGRLRFLRTAENDFEGTRMTIPRARDTTGQDCDGGAFVSVHAGHGQATCISEQYGGHIRGQSCGIADCA
jgi:hypothetical protein